MDMNGSFQKPWRSQANTEKKVWSNLAANFPPKAESFVWKRMKKGELSTWEQIKSDFFRSTKEIEKNKKLWCSNIHDKIDSTEF